MVNASLKRTGDPALQSVFTEENQNRFHPSVVSVFVQRCTHGIEFLTVDAVSGDSLLLRRH